ncbi:hypothetical protein AB0A77_18940 [Streptomyces varsoviensis]|uniref:hypothetical protein n=1 Tax=Streptomyces varsoviensis TaxID=67373 RepID=UPI0033E4D06E
MPIRFRGSGATRRSHPGVRELYANVSAYDATYVARAEGDEAPLVTTDGRLARSGRGKGAFEVFDEAAVGAGRGRPGAGVKSGILRLGGPSFVG